MSTTSKPLLLTLKMKILPKLPRNINKTGQSIYAKNFSRGERERERERALEKTLPLLSLCERRIRNLLTKKLVLSMLML